MAPSRLPARLPNAAKEATDGIGGTGDVVGDDGPELRTAAAGRDTGAGPSVFLLMQPSRHASAALVSMIQPQDGVLSSAVPRNIWHLAEACRMREAPGLPGDDYWHGAVAAISQGQTGCRGMIRRP